MSPSRSKRSGAHPDRSRFIHVPSDVSNASFVVGPRSALTSHFSHPAAPVRTEGGENKAVAAAMEIYGSWCSLNTPKVGPTGMAKSLPALCSRGEPPLPAGFGSLSRLRHRYHEATERYGRHASPSLSMRAGVGRFRHRYARWMAVTMPRSPTGRTSGRWRRKIRKHFGGPAADAFHLDERLDHILVVHFPRGRSGRACRM